MRRRRETFKSTLLVGILLLGLGAAAVGAQNYPRDSFPPDNYPQQPPYRGSARQQPEEIPVPFPPQQGQPYPQQSGEPDQGDQQQVADSGAARISYIHGEL